jgi:histidinol-phosphate aminotransferase
MDRVRSSNGRLVGIEPYDAKNLPAEVFLSANENPLDVPPEVKDEIVEAIRACRFNRYPDPLAHGLRRQIADSFEIGEDCILMGNGGDEHLLNIFLAYGGPTRKALVMPPTFSVYAYNAHITGTEVVEVPLDADFGIDCDAVIDRVSRGDVDIVIVTNPNNPTGPSAPDGFIERLLATTDALVLADEAYIEFCPERSAFPLLADNANLLMLRTFSKAYACAGVRLGYLIGHPEVIGEFTKVRQPYSVDAVSQAIASVAWRNRSVFEEGIARLVSERERMLSRLRSLEGVEAFPSDSNFILVRVPDAHHVWERLYEEHSVLVRDFSSSRYLENCLRVSMGTTEECDRFVQALETVLG